MQTHARRPLLAQALDPPAGAAVISRPTVEAALWQTIGWERDEGVIARLMAVVDAYADSCARRAVNTWVRRASPVVPSPVLDPAQVQAVRRQLDAIRRAGGAPAAHRPLPARGVADDADHLAEVISVVFGREACGEPAADHVPEPAAERATAHTATALGELSTPAAPASEPGAGSGHEAEPGELTLPELPEQGNSFCTKCRRDLPSNQFWRNSRRASGVDSQCKVCRSLKDKHYRDNRRARLAAEAAAPQDEEKLRWKK